MALQMKNSGPTLNFQFRSQNSELFEKYRSKNIGNFSRAESFDCSVA